MVVSHLILRKMLNSKFLISFSDFLIKKHWLGSIFKKITGGLDNNYGKGFKDFSCLRITI